MLVVGAGPTGLLLASELQRRGVPCHLIDSRPAPLHWDRATVVHPRSLQIFEAIGLVHKLLDVGCRQRVIKIHSGGTVLGAIDLSTSKSIYGFNLGLSEEVTESVLTEYLHKHGGEVTRSSRLVGLKPHSDGVLAEIAASVLKDTNLPNSGQSSTPRYKAGPTPTKASLLTTTCFRSSSRPSLITAGAFTSDRVRRSRISSRMPRRPSVCTSPPRPSPM